MNLGKMIHFNEKGDERGKLVVVESLDDIPFEIKRIFYIYGSDAHIVRGQHANRNSQFILINICGSSKVKLFDGKNEVVYELNEPHVGLYIPKMIWKDMYDFSEDSVLLVIASEHYDELEYIRSKVDYLKEIV